MGTNITGIGNANAIGFKSRVTGGIYFPPELKDVLVGVWSAYGKSNDSTDRNIIKNKIKDRGGDFVISNAAFKLNSGFGKYEVDFTTWSKRNVLTSNNDNSFSFESKVSSSLLYYSTTIGVDTPSFKIKANISNCLVYYYYINDKGTLSSISILESGEFELPISHNTLYNGNIGIGFEIGRINGTGTGTITQIPSYQGAFVTDGIDDLITSTKTVQEMLGGSNEITVVSMAHFIKGESNAPEICRINQIRRDTRSIRNSISKIGKSGIFGYTYKNGVTTINNILGDKNDCTAEGNLDGIVAPFSVEGYYYNNNSNPLELCSIAWYWTVIANKVLTTDQINQVIAYFNLDRTLKPDMLCNITKQGITNDNHADFNDKLIDYSGNGRDIQMNNLAWKGGSGIAAKQYETFKDWLSESSSTSIIKQIDEFTRIVESTTNGYWVSRIRRDSDLDKVYDPINVYLYQDNNFLIHECKYEVDGVKYSIPIYISVGKGYHKLEIYTKDRYTELPENAEKVVLSEWYFPKSNKGSIKYSLIPSYKGGILLDGVNDFGKVTGMPIYKDYTIVVDYERISGIEQAWAEALISKSYIANQGAFVLMETNGTAKHSYSFGAYTTFNKDDSTRTLLYQSKYKCGDVDLNVGTGIDGDTLWLGTYRDNYSSFFNGAIYSLMTFPYSMSEFLIERQLKKHKLGTLYPNMVEFRPVIKANANYKITYYQIDSTNTWKSIKVGDYIVIGAKLAFQITFDNDASELKEVVSPQLSGIIVEKRPSNPGYNIYSYITSKSPQKINITIDEYIRFEDIVQPYPVLLRFKDENGNEVSWGGKFKVGSTITRIGSIADPESNLLNGLYSISGLSLNGKAVTSSTSIVEKQMVFKTTATYLLDNNEPKCILSPRLLRIPNSSYKILGYIPDISGHGNHGKINNSAYAEGSGVNEDGSYQFDGVDDFVTIPTLFSGGKQMLMKVNWDNAIAGAILYDQRGHPNEFAVYNADGERNNPVFAYQARNSGQTYIDGILNKNIKASELRAITHNITITNELSTWTSRSSPVIGSNRLHDAYFTNMALYDFMLFDSISTDDKILELNEYVGIEAKVELPPYYWDAYGKTNLDADKATIQQRGVAVGDYDITNYNHTYEGMSGYNGYPVVFGANKTWANESNGYVTSITSNTIHITNVLNVGLALLYSYVKYNGNLQNIKEIPSFKIEIKGLEGRSKFIYKYLATSDATKETNLSLGNGTHELPKSFLPTEALIDNVMVGFSISPIEEGVTNFLSDITIEVLPEYENGLAYDGVSDFTDNKNIPILTDFTFIIKREILGLETNESMLVIKGDKVYNNGIGNAFILEHNSNGVNYVYSYGKLNQIKRNDSKIIYLTPKSYNGNPIIKGENGDNLGLVLGRHWRGIIYKTILYSKTISLLQINFLKNLMERDEIIDLNNPIFIKNE